MKENYVEQPRDLFTGVSFISELGASFSNVKLEVEEEDAPIRDKFLDREDVKRIIAEAKEFRSNNKQKGNKVFNGVMAGHPRFSLSDAGDLLIKADRLHYFIYFAAHKLAQEGLLTEDEREAYSALSVNGMVYNPVAKVFYFNKRPVNSQEDPGLIDAAGGILAPDKNNIFDPCRTMQDRMKAKLGVQTAVFECVGISKTFDTQFSMYLITYLGFTEESSSISDDVHLSVGIHEIENILQSNKVSKAARVSLLMALAQPYFITDGWGPEHTKTYFAND